MTLQPPIAIIAGSGPLPLRLYHHLKNDDRQVLLIGLQGHGDDNLPTEYWFPMGQAQAIITLLKSHNIAELVMIGRVSRPSLKDLKPDATARKILGKGLASFFKGDNTLLTSIGSYLDEHHHIKIKGIHDFMPHLVARAGTLGKIKPDLQALSDIKKAMQILQDLSPHDIGQSLVIQQGLILGIEALEGTDALIARSAGLAHETGPRPILVKAPKQGQDQRLDMPTIGLPTLKGVVAGNFAGIAFASGGTLMLNQEDMVICADEKGLFLYGVSA